MIFFYNLVLQYACLLLAEVLLLLQVRGVDRRVVLVKGLGAPEAAAADHG